MTKVQLILVSTVLAAIGLGLYYGFYLKPKLEKPQQLLEDQKVLMRERELWLENQIAWKGLGRASLRPGSIGVSTTAGLNQLKTNIDNGKKESGDTDFWDNQEKLYSEVKTRMEILNNLWNYDPIADLKDQPAKTLTGRINAAKSGLGKMVEQIDDSAYKNESKKTQVTLDEFGAGRITITVLSSQFTQLRLSGWSWVSKGWQTKQAKDLFARSEAKIQDLNKELEKIREELNPKSELTESQK
jgi:hypothetical protein